MTRRPATPTLVAIALLVVHASLGIWHAWTTSATYDETTHIASGYLTWVTGDHRLNPEHPPTAKLWATLPLLALAPWPGREALTHPDSLGPPNSDRRRLQEAWRYAATDFLQQWTVGPMLLYGKADTVTTALGMDSRRIPPTRILSQADFLNDPDQIVRIARVPIIVLSVTLAWLLFAWTRALFGATGALLALALYALDPNLIAHGSLVTTDVPLACFLFASVFAWWRVLGDLSARHVVAAVVWPILAVTTKLTAILLVPMLAAAGAVRILSASPWSVPVRWHGHARTRRGRAILVAGLLGTTALGGYAGIWGVYGFRFPMAKASATGAPPAPPLRTALLVTARTKMLLDSIPSGDFPTVEAQIIPAGMTLDVGSRLIEAMHRHHVLPESFLFGTAIARLYGLRRLSFLNGEISRIGFRWYFGVAALLKTPLLTILLVVLGSIAWVRRPAIEPRTIVALIAPIATYAVSALSSTLNIGYRHLLPLLPFCLTLSGVLPGLTLPTRTVRARFMRAGLVGSVIVLGLQFVWTKGRPHPIAPHFLEYFNEMAGGPDGGRHHLVDSNLDWGQDLPALSNWMRRHKVSEPINLCYFGMADPRWYGIRYRAMPGCDFLVVPGSVFSSGRAGLPQTIFPLEESRWLVVSATMLSGTYFTTENVARWRDFLAVYATPIDTVGHTMFVYRIRRGAY